MSKYLEMVRETAGLAGELNKFEGLSARITGAHTILATYKEVDVRVEVISTEKFRCTRVQDGFCYTPFWLGQDAAWRVVQTATHDNGINASPNERFWEGELDRETARKEKIMKKEKEDLKWEEVMKVLDKWEESYTANRDDWYGWDYCCVQNLRDALWDISTNATPKKNPEDIEF